MRFVAFAWSTVNPMSHWAGMIMNSYVPRARIIADAATNAVSTTPRFSLRGSALRPASLLVTSSSPDHSCFGSSERSDRSDADFEILAHRAVDALAIGGIPLEVPDEDANVRILGVG